MKTMTAKRKPAIRETKPKKKQVSEVIHVCSKEKSITDIEKNIEDIQMLLVGNHEPQNGVVYKMLGAIKDINEINEKLTGIGGIVKELHEESIGKKEVVKKSDTRWDRIFKILGTVIALGMLFLGYRNLVNKSDKIITKQDDQSVPFVVDSRGKIMALPDSTRIIFFNNDSARYLIKKEK
jgi:hypothetical protein